MSMFENTSLNFTLLLTSRDLTVHGDWNDMKEMTRKLVILSEMVVYP